MNIYDRIDVIVDGFAILLLGLLLGALVWFVAVLIFVLVSIIVYFPMVSLAVAILPVVCYYMGMVARKYGWAQHYEE